jgi:Ala-tRNA(Pro) deacylase
MSVRPAVQDYLRHANVPYAVFPHEPAFTAQTEAEATHIPRRDWAKAVVCFADGQPIQAIVAADCRVNLDRLARLAGADILRLAREDELVWLYPDCEPGAMPPLGPLYKQAVFVDEALAAEDRIAFNAGTHEDAVAMRFADFAALARPIVGSFGERVDRMPHRTGRRALDDQC